MFGRRRGFGEGEERSGAEKRCCEEDFEECWGGQYLVLHLKRSKSRKPELLMGRQKIVTYCRQIGRTGWQARCSFAVGLSMLAR